MSLPEHCVFLPSYLLEYTSVDDPLSRINSEVFLSTATPTQLLETIIAFYPHFKFTKKAKEDHKLLRLIFLETVASRLSHVIIGFKSNTNYFQAPLRIPNFDPERLSITIDSKADILKLDAKRTETFNNLCVSYLTIGQYCLAGEYLNGFIDTYESLTEDELKEIRGAHINAQDALQDCQSHLQDSYESIEKIQFRLRHPAIPPTERKDLDDQLKHSITSLKANQKMFNGNIEDVAFLTALIDHHRTILHNHTPRVDEEISPNKAASEHEPAPMN